MKKVFVTGASGLVGSRFVELYSTKYDFSTPNYPDFNLLDERGVKAIIKQTMPEVVVNFAAYTDVGEAEKQRGTKEGDCYKINVLGVENLLRALGLGMRFIQISTDMVYSGSKDDPGPYSEDHKLETDPLKVTWYGCTKALGEQKVLKLLGTKATILRLIYPVRAKFDTKLDYLRKPLKLFDEGKLYPMFSDQNVSIAYIDEVAQVIDKIIELDARGIFHAASSDTTTPYELISFLIEKARGKKNAVTPSLVADFLKKVDSPVRYPQFGGLKVEETEKRLGINFSTCYEIVDKLIIQGLGK